MTRTLALLLALSLAGCGHPSRGHAGNAWAPTVPPGTWQGDVRVPTWLAAYPELVAEARAEIAAVGLPAGYRVVIMDPGQFSAPSSPTGLAQGLCDPWGAQPTVYVAWSFPPASRPLLPMLAHEAEHAQVWERTHDMDAFRAVDIAGGD